MYKLSKLYKAVKGSNYKVVYDPAKKISFFVWHSSADMPDTMWELCGESFIAKSGVVVTSSSCSYGQFENAVAIYWPHAKLITHEMRVNGRRRTFMSKYAL